MPPECLPPAGVVRASTAILSHASCTFCSSTATSLPVSFQDLVRDVKEPEAALQAAGLYFSYDAAVCWVTPRQLAVLTEELEAMEQNLSYELTAYYVQDCLLRARFANDRVTYTRTERGVEVDI